MPDGAAGARARRARVSSRAADDLFQLGGDRDANRVLVAADSAIDDGGNGIHVRLHDGHFLGARGLDDLGIAAERVREPRHHAVAGTRPLAFELERYMEKLLKRVRVSAL